VLEEELGNFFVNKRATNKWKEIRKEGSKKLREKECRKGKGDPGRTNFRKAVMKGRGSRPLDGLSEKKDFMDREGRGKGSKSLSAL